MILYISITVLTVFLSFFVNGTIRRQLNIPLKTAAIPRQEMINKIAIFSIFTVLFAVSALRVGVGNDYWIYRTGFLQINLGDTPVSYEIGFKAVVLALQKLFGTDNYKAIFAFFAFVTIALSLKGIYDTSDCFFYSFFLFMTNGFYFMSFSNVRYYFVIGIVLYSMKFLFNKKYVSFIVWICIAALFHKTALLVIPVYFICWFVKWSRKTIWMIPAFAAALIAGKSIIRFLLFKIYPYYEGDWRFDNNDISYINILKCAAILVFCLIYYKKAIKGNGKAEMLFNLNLMALLLYSFAYYIPELTRICYYMVIGQIFLIPVVLKAIDNRKQRIFFTACVGVAYTVYFAFFLHNGSNSGINILPYLSWLFVS